MHQNLSSYIEQIRSAKELWENSDLPDRTCRAYETAREEALKAGKDISQAETAGERAADELVKKEIKDPQEAFRFRTSALAVGGPRKKKEVPPYLKIFRYLP